MVPQRCLLAHFKAILNFRCSEFTSTYSRVCINGQVNTVRLTIKCTIASQWTINIWRGTIYFAVEGKFELKYRK